NKEAKDIKELKQHLEIVLDKDDDVYTKAIPLARKAKVDDAGYCCQIVLLRRMMLLSQVKTGRMIDESNKDKGAELMNEKEEKETEEVRVNPDDAQVEGRQANIYHIDMDHATKVLISVAAVVQADVLAAPINAAAVVTTTAPAKVDVPSTRQRRGVVIRDPEKESSAKTLNKTKSKDKKKESRAIAIINETSAQKAAKRRRLNKEAKDVKELKQHLEIVLDKDDDVYTKATPLARKVPLVDYQIIHVNNKPRYKIIH
nr:hypothetical protein [Tanacetum cinerariifolium]